VKALSLKIVAVEPAVLEKRMIPILLLV